MPVDKLYHGGGRIYGLNININLIFPSKAGDLRIKR